jgi:hypothetical protein
MFQRNMSPASSALKSKLAALLSLLFNPEDGGDIQQKCQLTFNRLHGIIFQKTVLFNLYIIVINAYYLSSYNIS